MQEKAKLFWENNKKILLFCIAVTFLWGIAAHGYTMMNFQLSHDSLDGLYAAGRENNHKIELGRVLVPAYRYLFRGQLAMPWLTGLLTLLWISLAVWMVISVLGIQSKLQIALISGVMTVNLTITALAGTFIHDLDQDLFGMMMACLAVLLWQKRYRGWLAGGAVALAVCLGLYPSFVSMFIGLIMIVLLMDLIRGEKIALVLRRCIDGVLMLAIGSVLFFVMVKGITAATVVPLASRNNSLSALGNFQLLSIPRLVFGLYKNWLEYFVSMPNTWLFPQAASWLNVLLMIVTIGGFATVILIKKDISVLHKAMVIGIAVLLPFGMNICYLLTSGFIHHLMQYAFILSYVLSIVLVHYLDGHREHRPLLGPVRWICSILIVLLLWSGVQTANAYHFKKTSATLATNARMTNVYSDMLAMGYIPGETPLITDGYIYIYTPDGFAEVSQIWGGSTHNTITSDRKSMRAYFQFVFGDRAAFCSDEQWDQLLQNPVVQNMPRYPNEGYIDFIDGVMVVNLS